MARRGWIDGGIPTIEPSPKMDPQRLRVSLLFGSIATTSFVLLTALDWRYCESCLTDKDFFLKGCHVPRENFVSPLPMIFPNFFFCTFLAHFAPHSLFEANNIIRHALSFSLSMLLFMVSPITQPVRELYYWCCFNLNPPKNKRAFDASLNIFIEHGTLTQMNDGDFTRECIMLDGVAAPYFLAPVLLRQVKEGIAARDLKNSGVSR